jgi:DNA-binding response OmpR family regulator
VLALKLLLAEEERALCSSMQEALSNHGFSVQAALDGVEGMRRALNEYYDILVLSDSLPGHSGLSIVRAMRQQGRSMPVLLLTAHTEAADRILCLDCGADDCLTKPFDMDELLARTRAMTRRRGEFLQNDVLYFADLTLCASDYTLWCGAQQVRLSRREMEILRYFLTRLHTVVDKEELFSRIWGYDNTADITGVEVYVSFLRKKIREIGAHVEIRSVRGVGYRLVDTL